MKKEIAFFDFDGTITTKDTLLEFIKFSHGKARFYLGFFLNLQYLIGYKLKFISNQKAKEKILQHFYQGTSIDDFKTTCANFSKNLLPSLIRPKAIFEITRLKKNGCKIAIVSASPECWIQLWAENLQADLIATKLEINNNRITGKINGKNCRGKEKVVRIKEKYSLSLFEKIYAYGDSSGDLAMFSIAHKSFMKPFR